MEFQYQYGLIFEFCACSMPSQAKLSGYIIIMRNNNTLVCRYYLRFKVAFPPIIIVNNTNYLRPRRAHVVTTFALTKYITFVSRNAESILF